MDLIRTLFVSDIFGITPALKQLQEVVSPNPLYNKLVDPYGGQPQNFISEREAYQKFQSLGGVESYIDIVTDTVSELDGLRTIVGFSAGGAAIWKAMEGIKNNSDVKLVLFYPGQIRHYLDVEPTFPTTIFWPYTEMHFSVSKTIQELKFKKNVQHIHTSFPHGFMNVESVGFSKAAYLQYEQYLLNYCKNS